MTRTRTTLACAVAVALAWAAPATARAAGDEQQRPQRSQTGEGGAQAQRQGTRSLSEELKTSLQKLHAANQAEIDIGRMAQQQAASQEVKQFAKDMVEQHQKSDQQLRQVAQRFGAQLEGEEYRNALKESREKRQELQQKRGAEFDRAYMEFMVQDHQEDVQSVHDAAKKAAQGAHPQLAQTLGNIEATLHQHHAMAQQVQRQLQRGERQAQATPSQQMDQPATAGGSPQTGGMTASAPAQRAQQDEGQQQHEREQQAQRGQQASKSVVGTIESLEGDSLSLRNELGEKHDFSIDDRTRFTRDGQTISKDQIGEGDQVRAAFTGDQGNFQATEIILMKDAKRAGSGQGGSSDSGQQQPGERGEKDPQKQK